MATLSRMSMRATGTVRENRIAKCLPSSIKAISKQSRGSYMYDYRFDVSNGVFLVRWHDNSVVTMATNYDTINLMASCRRWSKHTKDQVNVTQPLLIKQCNQAMGGVDLHNWNAGKYAFQKRGKE